MSIIGAVMLYLIGNPQALQTIMGNQYYVMYGFIIVAILGIIYNVLFAGSSQNQNQGA